MKVKHHLPTCCKVGSESSSGNSKYKPSVIFQCVQWIAKDSQEFSKIKRYRKDKGTDYRCQPNPDRTLWNYKALGQSIVQGTKENPELTD